MTHLKELIFIIETCQLAFWDLLEIKADRYAVCAGGKSGVPRSVAVAVKRKYLRIHKKHPITVYCDGVGIMNGIYQ